MKNELEYLYQWGEHVSWIGALVFTFAQKDCVLSVSLNDPAPSLGHEAAEKAAGIYTQLPDKEKDDWIAFVGGTRPSTVKIIRVK